MGSERNRWLPHAINFPSPRGGGLGRGAFVPLSRDTGNMLRNIIHSPPRTFVYAKALRRSMTDAEKILWSKLRRRHLLGYRFRKQVPLGPYIADFFCVEELLIIELDGSGHAEQILYDEERESYFLRHHMRIIRFWNHEVFENLDGVLETIVDILQVLQPPLPLTPSRGEGGK